jgi:putative membrane protein
MKRTILVAGMATLFSISMAAQGSMTTGAQTSDMTGNQGSAKSQSSGQTSGQSSGQSSSQKGKLAPVDKQFAEETAMSNRAEIELSQLAAQKATNPSVKQFAQMMVQDHGQANQQFASTAQQKGITPPTDVPEPDKRLRSKLQDASGQTLDMMYMSHMYTAHVKDIACFQMYAQTGHDPTFKQFATSQLPILQKHLQEVTSILSQMGVTPPSGSGSAAGSSTSSSLQ